MPFRPDLRTVLIHCNHVALVRGGVAAIGHPCSCLLVAVVGENAQGWDFMRNCCLVAQRAYRGRRAIATRGGGCWLPYCVCGRRSFVTPKELANHPFYFVVVVVLVVCVVVLAGTVGLW